MRADYRRQRLPKDRYASPTFHALEWDKMWTRVWLLACREADIPASGDGFRFEVGPESILIVRQRDGDVRAFYNTCRHRGTRLCEQRQGRMETLQCPYHGWAWHGDGSLLRMSDARSFPASIDRNALALRRVRCERWGGFVWVNMAPNAEPLLEFLGEITDVLAPYRLSEHTLLRDLTVEWDANWKLVMENGNETYHIQSVHPQLLDMVDDMDTDPVLYDKHSRFIVRFGRPSHRCKDTHIGPGLAAYMRKVGMEDAAFPTNVHDVREAMMKSQRKHFQSKGIDYPLLDDAALIDNLHVHVFPGIMFNIVLPGFWLFRVRPHPTDPTRTFFDFQEYEMLPAHRPRPARPVHTQHKFGEISIDSVLDQDAALMPLVQRAMASRGFEGPLFGEQETRLIHMHEVLDRYCFES